MSARRDLSPDWGGSGSCGPVGGYKPRQMVHQYEQCMVGQGALTATTILITSSPFPTGTRNLGKFKEHEVYSFFLCHFNFTSATRNILFLRLYLSVFPFDAFRWKEGIGKRNGTAIQAEELGVRGWMVKPFDLE